MQQIPAAAGPSERSKPLQRRRAGACTDELGNAYLGGETYGEVAATNLGPYDAILAKFDPQGDLEWIDQFGTTSDDGLFALASDRHGSIYGAGATFGVLGSSNLGGRDLFVMKVQVPEPPALAFVVGALSILIHSASLNRPGGVH